MNNNIKQQQQHPKEEEEVCVDELSVLLHSAAGEQRLLYEIRVICTVLYCTVCGRVVADGIRI